MYEGFSLSLDGARPMIPLIVLLDAKVPLLSTTVLIKKKFVLIFNSLPIEDYWLSMPIESVANHPFSRRLLMFRVV